MKPKNIRVYYHSRNYSGLVLITLTVVFINVSKYGITTDTNTIDERKLSKLIPHQEKIDLRKFESH